MSTNEQESNKNQQANDQKVISLNSRRAAAGGIVSAVVSLIGVLIINFSSGGDARILLEGMLPSIRFLCSSLMTVTATILALMLTMLSLSHAGEGNFIASHYDRVQQISLLDTITFAAATILLLFISIPFSQSQNGIPATFYTILYYIILVYAAVLGGALISIIILLYSAITDMVRVVHPNKESNLLID
jgi:hypothetical protein